MPIDFRIDGAQDLTVFNLTGQVTLSELIDTLDAYGKSDPTFYEIYDAREVDGDRLTAAEIQKLAVYLKSHADRRALGSKIDVIVSNDIDFGIPRMISSLIDQEVPYKMEVSELRPWIVPDQWFDEP